MKEHNDVFEVQRAEGPVVAAAIHDGHAVRPDVAASLALSEQQRLHEEDPFTWLWTEVGDTRVRMLRSRFEVDVNRPRELAVYQRPEDAWGLEVWLDAAPREATVQRSLEEYDEFYNDMYGLLAELRDRYGRFLVYDIHSYNHRRNGRCASPFTHPTINLGTGSLDRERWAPVVDTFLSVARQQTVNGHPVDARENVKFQGGYFSRWVHRNFGESGCALAVEVKKVFMDEDTGTPYGPVVEDVRLALQATIKPVVRALWTIPTQPAAGVAAVRDLTVEPPTQSP